MLAERPPMGWNSWNTFGNEISEKLIMEIADAMVEKGYREAGYEYLIIDDCWAMKERDENGLLVADPGKFPHGMKYLADYIRDRGLKFGMYSCSGLRTCCGYPGSYDHEYADARTFAQWGVDYLKYDGCNFPEMANGKNRYHRMSMALKATGRDIVFAACNALVEAPWKSMGVHLYRSTGDINDSYQSFKEIAVSQIDQLCSSGFGCFNDMDMLTVGMYGKGNVGFGGCTEAEYRTHFALWCLFGVPLILGGDIRKLDEASRVLLLNRELIRINQDGECRPPYLVSDKNEQYFFVRHLSEREFVLAYFNLSDKKNLTANEFSGAFDEIGIPYGSGYGLDMVDVFTGENLGIRRDYFIPQVESHDCKLYRAKLVEI